MLGRFLEVSVQTPDIRASVEFYEALGFSQCETGDTWKHPYGVLTDGTLTLGLHQYGFPSPSLTFVKPDVASHAARLAAAGHTLAFQRLDPDTFNEIGLRDPAAQMLAILEARTFSPSDRARDAVSSCGAFVAYSIPAADFAHSVAFWTSLGYTAEEERDSPYPHRDLASPELALSLHRPRFSDRPLLVFRSTDFAARIARIEARGIARLPELPSTLDPRAHALIETPEGLAMLLSAAASAA